MTWTELLKDEIASTYDATEGLLDLVEEGSLDWKPATGENWMTTGQLVLHLTSACGACCRGFVTGDWGMPEGGDVSEMSEEEMLPPAAKMPAARSVAEVRERLAADRALALRMVDDAGEDRLGTERIGAPWNPAEQLLGHQLLQMIEHLKQHKGQLYYYLKLQGKPVHTGHLYGMG
ncbi:MAG: DinB family protein [Planctomycetota bacterium]|jgi:hypothetical protein